MDALHAPLSPPPPIAALPLCYPQANIWIAIFSYIGNYFWTHYFFKLLGAEYTFVSWRLNGVSGRARDEAAGQQRGRVRRAAGPNPLETPNHHPADRMQQRRG